MRPLQFPPGEGRGPREKRENDQEMSHSFPEQASECMGGGRKEREGGSMCASPMMMC